MKQGLTFDDVLHKYYADGKEFPSVTTIIRRVLGDKGHGTQWHMDRGSAAHGLYALMGGEGLITIRLRQAVNWQRRGVEGLAQP